MPRISETARKKLSPDALSESAWWRAGLLVRGAGIAIANGNYTREVCFGCPGLPYHFQSASNCSLAYHFAPELGKKALTLWPRDATSAADVGWRLSCVGSAGYYIARAGCKVSSPAACAFESRGFAPPVPQVAPLGAANHSADDCTPIRASRLRSACIRAAQEILGYPPPPPAPPSSPPLPPPPIQPPEPPPPLFVQKKANRMLDVFMLNDEVDLMRYRLAVHAPVAFRTLIFESRWTFTGAPKPLHARQALTDEEMARHRIKIVEVEWSIAQKLGWRAPVASSKADRLRSVIVREARNLTAKDLASLKFQMEEHQRRSIGLALIEEVHSLLRERADFLVHVSDVDEILDPNLLLAGGSRGGATIRSCRTPTLRHYHYGTHCAEYKPAFTRSIIFRAASLWLNFTSSHRA